jgi:hypothetical protein
MLYTGRAGRTLPATPVSTYRVAALLLDSLASKQSRLSGLTQLLDVGLSPSSAAKSLREQAKAFRDMDDESGSFAVIEQTLTGPGFLQRYFAEVQRMMP